ncbi:hypothetical protein ABC347_10485 [Sphingomonas sp. 1P06PA]|uniref:hypothetical protein n=1 Tax=Sphingomonas sp. 1P06PA TaxID=554121 RepID=UPI0039A5A7E5
MTAAHDDTQLKIMSSIGHVCIQWALLEHLLLGCIAAIENIKLEKTYIMFGSADVVARCGFAINLARDANLPGHFPARLDAIRKELNGGLKDRRNQVVHGVHAAADMPDAVRLTIAKWTGPRRHEVVSVMQMYELGSRLNELANSANAIQNEIFEWRIKMLENCRDHKQREFSERYPKVLLGLRTQIRASISRFRGQLGHWLD